MTRPDPPGADSSREIRRSQAPAPGPAVAAAHHLAASRARRAVEALNAVLRLTGITDEQDRERAHEAFLLAFPISYRLCRDRLDQPPEWPPTRQG